MAAFLAGLVPKAIMVGSRFLGGTIGDIISGKSVGKSLLSGLKSGADEIYPGLGRAGAKLIESVGSIFAPNKSKTQRIDTGEKAITGAADVVGKLAKAYKMQMLPEEEKRMKVKRASKYKYGWGGRGKKGGWGGMSGPELAYMENLKRIKRDVKQGEKFVERMSRTDIPEKSEKLEPTKPRKVRKKPRK